MPKLHLVRLQHYPILQQLQLEEALLRADDRNWCLINEGSPPAIVMGISGKPHELLHQELLNRSPIPVIRRFSGGGTVVVDHNTTFVTFIINNEVVNVGSSPEKILRWTEELYRPAIGHADFRVRENDYVFGERKFGGNAQYLRKGRWLHHSSLLWDYDPARMNYLLLPKKTPQYSQQRMHDEFLCKLGDYVTSKETWILRLLAEVGKRMELEETALNDALEVMDRPHRKATQLHI